MDSNFHLDQNKLFNDHFQDALIIRAICDDFNFPAEYSPVFVNIHIRGPEHFRSPPLPIHYYETVFNFLDPSSDDRIKNIIADMKNSPLKEELNSMYIKDKVKELDDLLSKKGAKSGYLSNQIKMIKQLYCEPKFMEHMITLYTFFVKPFMKDYDDEKVKKAFQKGILRDSNQETKE